MTDPINVDVGAMLNAVSELEDKHGGITTQVRSVQDDFSALASTWGGDAAATFSGAMSNYYDLCNKILTALWTLARDVDNSAIQYNTAHNLTNDAAQALSKQIQNTPVGLPGF